MWISKWTLKKYMCRKETEQRLQSLVSILDTLSGRWSILFETRQKKLCHLHYRSVCDCLGIIEQCQIIGAKYVQRVMDWMIGFVTSIHWMHVSCFVLYILYSWDAKERTCTTKKLLGKLFFKFQFFKIYQDRCQGECLEMVETMCKTTSSTFIWEAWDYATTKPWVVHQLARLGDECYTIYWYSMSHA